MTTILLVFFFALFSIEFCSSYRSVGYYNDAENLCNNQKCDKRVHTLCNNNISLLCRNKYNPIHLKNKEVRNILNLHNSHRDQLAWKSNAKNMNLLHWDWGLALMAQRWLQRCVRTKDTCTFIYNTSYTVSQSIFFSSSSYIRDIEHTTVYFWSEDKEFFEDSDANHITEQKCNNYTQIIWANTEFIGCAMATLRSGWGMICNYHPSGNVVGESVFLTGTPGSDCGRGIMSKKFTGLCGDDEINARYDFGFAKKPFNLLIFMCCFIIGNLSNIHFLKL